MSKCAGRQAHWNLRVVEQEKRLEMVLDSLSDPSFSALYLAVLYSLEAHTYSRQTSFRINWTALMTAWRWVSVQQRPRNRKMKDVKRRICLRWFWRSWSGRKSDKTNWINWGMQKWVFKSCGEKWRDRMRKVPVLCLYSLYLTAKSHPESAKHTLKMVCCRRGHTVKPHGIGVPFWMTLRSECFF